MNSSMPPPPSGQFLSSEAMLKSFQDWALEHGYAIVIRRSIKDKRYDLVCDKSRDYRGSRMINSHEKDQNEEKKEIKEEEKMFSTRKIGCPFAMAANFSKRISLWTLVVKCAEHNHPPSSHDSGHSVHRRLKKEEIQEVKRLSSAGVKPISILNSIKNQNPSSEISLSSLNTIYNARNAIRKKELGGRTTIQALVDHLQEKNFIYFTQNDSLGFMNYLFFSYKPSLSIARKYHTTFIMDCTYKTNRFKMPLLHIFGINCFKQSFTAAVSLGST